MVRVETPVVALRRCQLVAGQWARVMHQGINRKHPLLGASLPDGARIHFCGPPASRKHGVMAIRRHRRLDLPLDAYDSGPLREDAAEQMHDAREQPIAYLREAIRQRRTILISGGTDRKSTRLNSSH